MPDPSPDVVVPARLIEIEMSEPLPAISGDAGRALVVVMVHGQPLGSLTVDLPRGDVKPSTLAEIVAKEFGGRIEQHLRADGLATDAVPSVDSWPPPRCLTDLRAGPTSPMVSVIVPTHGRPRQLVSCVASLLAVDYPFFEVIVVDNAPPNADSRRMLEECFSNDSRVRYFVEERPGASLARNLGAKSARGEIVAFTDDDVLADRHWLAALVRGFDEDSHVECVTGLTLPMELATPAQAAFELYDTMTIGYERRLYDLAEHRASTLLYPYTAGVFGASNNVAFRRDRFLERGGFDSTLGPGTSAFGGEDLDAFLSLILSGERILYEPSAIIRHEHRREFSELYWQVFTYSAGFTAFLTKWAISDRRVARDLFRRVPRLLPAALLTSQRNSSKVNDYPYPAQLRWLERLGYLYGPLAYARSRAQTFRRSRARELERPVSRRGS